MISCVCSSGFSSDATAGTAFTIKLRSTPVSTHEVKFNALTQYKTEITEDKHDCTSEATDSWRLYSMHAKIC